MKNSVRDVKFFGLIWMFGFILLFGTGTQAAETLKFLAGYPKIEGEMLHLSWATKPDEGYKIFLDGLKIDEIRSGHFVLPLPSTPGRNLIWIVATNDQGLERGAKVLELVVAEGTPKPNYTVRVVPEEGYFLADGNVVFKTPETPEKKPAKKSRTVTPETAAPSDARRSKVGQDRTETQNRRSTVSASGFVAEITDSNFKIRINEADAPMLVMFYTTWCGYCRKQTPILEAFAKNKSGQIGVGKLNTEANQKIASQFEVSSIPTLILFQKGKEVGRARGYHDAQELERFISRFQ